MEKRGLNSFSLKLIALVFMTAGALLLLLDSEAFAYERICFRLAAVLCAFVLTEGFSNTSNRQKYLGRLVIAGILMYIGNHLTAHFTGSNMPLEYGMFLTLAAGFFAMWVFEWARTEAGSFEGKMIGITAAAIISILAMMFAESGFCVIPVILIGYFFHGKKLWICLLVLVISTGTRFLRKTAIGQSRERSHFFFCMGEKAVRAGDSPSGCFTLIIRF